MFKDSEETSLAKPGKTSVANQAWTRRATRRQQITDLINDRRASARLILAPKNLGTNWDQVSSALPTLIHSDGCMSVQLLLIFDMYSRFCILGDL